ncbi:hypothetical protein [Shewanella algae]|uniref:hypothetical protein n=1 Tax=Shewanella algae TaxID=38313 RepID=UPI0011842FAF|nr:hypothetical protein [Shewanella algae]MBO2643876.1 hypothetical protein [Shewanella algae]QTE95371.1 hypothetical protein JKK45_02020 [Shewanella algae]TVL50789.1 hypothetical protein AYI98_07615 [Shewanella algae]
MNQLTHSELIREIVEHSVGDFDVYTLARSLLQKLRDAENTIQLVDECKEVCWQLESEGKLLRLNNGCFIKSV